MKSIFKIWEKILIQRQISTENELPGIKISYFKSDEEFSLSLVSVLENHKNYFFSPKKPIGEFFNHILIFMYTQKNENLSDKYSFYFAPRDYPQICFNYIVYESPATFKLQNRNREFIYEKTIASQSEDILINLNEGPFLLSIKGNGLEFQIPIEFEKSFVE